MYKKNVDVCFVRFLRFVCCAAAMASLMIIASFHDLIRYYICIYIDIDIDIDMILGDDHDEKVGNRIWTMLCSSSTKLHE
jgi:hypothetical protein